MPLHSLHSLVAPLPHRHGPRTVTAAGTGNAHAERPLEALDGGIDLADCRDVELRDAALSGRRDAIVELLRHLLPAARGAIRQRLAGFRAALGDPQRLVEDLSQELFLELFADDGRVLRRWHPKHGLPLARFVALIADRRTTSWLRSRHASERNEALDSVSDEFLQQDADPARWLHSAQVLGQLFAVLNARLSPLGRRLFELLFIEEREVADIEALLDMRADAIYAWRSRLRRRVAETLDAIHAQILDGSAP